jgi:hypothetical protein
MREEKKRAAVAGQFEEDTPFIRKCHMTWAALIKVVYEAEHRACRGVDPLKCPRCGGTMKIVGFIEDPIVIEKIMRHCNLWKEGPRPPPAGVTGPPVTDSPTLDYAFFFTAVS